MKMVENWRESWRWFSQWAFVMAGSLQTTWVALPPNLQTALPATVVSSVAAAICVLGFVGRLIDQGKKYDPADRP